MKIGFDAKRVFFNRSGLGNYSRGVVELMAKYYGEDEYLLFTPKAGNPVHFQIPDGVRTVTPNGFVNRKMSSLWRSYNMSGSIRAERTELFHGLSNELPGDICKSGARSVLTMHDIIFVHFPELYKPLDRYMYTKKYRSSCMKADRIIAISIQTRNDLVNTWKIPEEKIDVVYQGCNPIFYDAADPLSKEQVRQKYDLPDHYILSVGTVEERKNLLLTVKAIAEGRIDIDLVVCGRATPYVDKIREYALKHGILNRIRFLHHVGFQELPVIYQLADVLVYASFYEGFGIPILEGFNSGIPVITSQGGVFPETGGDAALYVDPHDVDSMTTALNSTLYDSGLREEMIRKGHAYALNFRDEKVAADIRKTYRKVME